MFKYKFTMNHLKMLKYKIFPSIVTSGLKTLSKPSKLIKAMPLNTNPCCYYSTTKPKTPDLIYMPHLIRWMKSKLSFKYLKKLWDPEFSEGAFIYGSTRAVCRITEIIHSGKVEELNGLMSVSAKIRLKDDINYRLTPNQKNIILLKPEDIKILVPVNVNFTKEGLVKICRIALRVLALKWHEQAPETYKLVLVALQTEFSRDYSEHAHPEWIISNFTILECAMLTEATATR